MARYRIIDTAAWPLPGGPFHLYRQFANPSFNLCVPIEAQRLYECAKDRRVSFFSARAYARCARPTGAAAPAARARWRGD